MSFGEVRYAPRWFLGENVCAWVRTVVEVELEHPSPSPSVRWSCLTCVSGRSHQGVVSLISCARGSVEKRFPLLFFGCFWKSTCFRKRRHATDGERRRRHGSTRDAFHWRRARFHAQVRIHSVTVPGDLSTRSCAQLCVPVVVVVAVAPPTRCGPSLIHQSGQFQGFEGREVPAHPLRGYASVMRGWNY